MQKTPDHVLLICAICQGAQSSVEMQNRLTGALPDGFAVQTVDCMARCGVPTTVGFQAKGKAQYLFGAIETDAEIAGLVEFAAQYQQSADGWTKATERPKALFTKTLARLPRLQSGDAA